MNAYTKKWAVLVSLFVLLISGASLAHADEPPRVRVVHAGSGLPNLDIYISDILFYDNIGYNYIAEYAPVDAGDGRVVKLIPSGTGSGGPVLREIGETFSNDRDYTLVVAGRVNEIEYWRLDDDNSLPGDGTSKVRVVHASTNTPTVEFCLGDVCKTIAFKKDSGYFLLDPGTYQPLIRLNGVEATYIKNPPLALQNNSVHTVFIVGQLQDQPTGLQLLYTLDNGESLQMPYPQPPAGAPLDKPAPGNSQPLPPPQHPPVTGAFLPARFIGILAGAAMVLLGGLGFWLTRR